ncbi:hypothetical protein BKA70DRAFT_1100822, partial [Coprinopsis sp. MPI-PUGE-AT-0042]
STCRWSRREKGSPDLPPCYAQPSSQMVLSANADCTQGEKSEQFFFDQPDLILKAGNTLFKVPSFYFRRESKVFQDMYQLPQGDAAPVDGSSEEHPLILHGIQANDLECILRVMFPSSLEAEDRLSVDEWKSVLELSHMWDMSALFNRAVKNLSTLLDDDPAERYAMAKRYAIPGWTYNAIDKLVRRAKPVSASDAVVLDDIALTVAICALRESCYVGHAGSTSVWYIRSGRESMEGAQASPVYSQELRQSSLTYEQQIRQDFETWIPKDEIPDDVHLESDEDDHLGFGLFD